MSETSERAMLAEARTEVGYADHKASMVLAALGIGFGAILGGLLAGNWQPSDQGRGEALWWIGTTLALGSLVVSASAVWPRYRKSAQPPDNVFYWGHVAAFESFEELSAALDRSPPSLNDRTRHQLWELSVIVARKYMLLRCAFVLAAAAVVAFGSSVGVAS
jgi:hypothetical protein